MPYATMPNLPPQHPRRQRRPNASGYGRSLTGRLIAWEREVFPVTRGAPEMGWWRYLQDAHRIGPKAWTARYKLYLRSAQWYATRAKVLERARWHCQGCGNPSPKLEVHHQHYKRVGREALNDLRALCRGCHLIMHQRADHAPGTGALPAGTLRHQRDVLRKRLKSEAMMTLVRDLAADPEPPRRIRRRPGGVKPEAPSPSAPSAPATAAARA